MSEPAVEELLLRVVRDVCQPMVIVGGEDRMVYVNNAFAELFGYDADTLRSQPIDRVFPDGAAVFGRVERGRSTDHVVEGLTRTGEDVGVQISVAGVFDDTGMSTMRVGLVRPLSWVTGAAASPAAIEEQYRLLAEHGTDMVARLAGDTTILFASKAVQMVLGYPAEEVVGKKLSDMVADEDRSALERRFQTLHAAEVVPPLTYSVRQADGGRAIVESVFARARGLTTPRNGLEVITATRMVSDIDRVRERLDVRERQLGAAFRLTHMGSWSWNVKDDTVVWSPELYEIFGLRPEQFTASFAAFLERVHPEDRQYVTDEVLAAVREKKMLDLHHRIIRLDGSIRQIRGLGELIRDETGDVIEIVGSAQDITAIRQTESALRVSEAKARAILETTVDGIITIDDRGIIQSVNPAAVRIFGYEPDEVIGANVRVLMPAPYRDEHHNYIRSYLETGHRKIIGIGREVLGLRKDGSTFPMELAVSEVGLDEGRVFTGIVRDITERRSLEREILRTSEDERRRIGQDLHDELGQMLTGIGLISQEAVRQLRARDAQETVLVEEITDLVRGADSYARNLARGLIPVDLDGHGLASALGRLAANVERLFAVECAFEEVGSVDIEDASVSTHLYRIAQEGVSNAVRHGNALRVKIILAAGPEHLRLRVVDNGGGFNRDEVNASGMGIRIMNHRARMIGGSLEIRPGVDGGTVVTCTVPNAVLRTKHVTIDTP